VSYEHDPAEVDRLHQAFVERLLFAVQTCLGRHTSPELLRAVTTYMSQSGLANVERACGDPQVAVSGGDQLVQYALEPTANADMCAWDLELTVRKFGFEQCIVSWGDSDEAADPSPASCSSKSSITKSCRIRFLAHGEEARVEADVLELIKDVQVLDERGRPLVNTLHGRLRRTGLLRRALMLGASFVAHVCDRCPGRKPRVT